MHLAVLDFKKTKKAEERAKESQTTKEKNYEDYAWKDYVKIRQNYKKFRVPEQNNYLKHHGLEKHLNSAKNYKVIR